MHGSVDGNSCARDRDVPRRISVSRERYRRDMRKYNKVKLEFAGRRITVDNILVTGGDLEIGEPWDCLEFWGACSSWSVEFRRILGIA